MTASNLTAVALLLINIVLTSCVLSHQLTDKRVERISIENAFMEEVNNELDRKYDGQVWITCHRIANSDRKAISVYGPDWNDIITKELEKKGCAPPSGQ